MGNEKFKSYEEYRKHILKQLDIISTQCLNMEIQAVQIKDDAAARGAMAAVHFIRESTVSLIDLIKIGYKGE